MRIRNTHCVELQLTPKELAVALGHPQATVREAEVVEKEGDVVGLRVHLEYLIATKGIPRQVRQFAASRGHVEEGHG